MAKPVRTYSVLYGTYKPYKKHKVWEDDGYLIVRGDSAKLEKMSDGRIIAEGTINLEELVEDNCVVVGKFECQIGSICERPCTQAPAQPEASPPIPLINSSKLAEVQNLKFQTPFRLGTGSMAPPPPVAPERRSLGVLGPKPNDERFCFPRPPPDFPLPRGTNNVTDVYLTHALTKACRPHQLEGIAFLYRCIMGYQHEHGEGAILADEMGLGKTLQCICLIYALTREGPFDGKPLLKRTLIIAPSSLVKNWEKEFHKWLGVERLRPFAVDTKNNKVIDYMKTIRANTKHPAVIISYENFMRGIEHLKNVPFDLLICDEGHRLKNTDSQAYKMIVENVTTARKILLTGTPVQNNLGELFALANFVNPEVFGKYSRFKRKFEDPINFSQEKRCPLEARGAGREANSELQAILNSFTLRRTKEMIAKYLPDKTEYIICCKPSLKQVALYTELIQSSQVSRIIRGLDNDQRSLFSIISSLRKLCNHPCLVKTVEADEETFLEEEEVVLDINNEGIEHSGKMIVLAKMLEQIKRTTTEKVVIVSNFTKTLDLIENLCKKASYTFSRLDGRTTTSKRQELVDQFNQPHSQTFIFLLSTKAGGVGLNLIGASRLIMFDLDWNPAHDLQAMARIWRDGQKRNVHIYRLITTGTIEEKIFQRQIKKDDLSTEVMHNESGMKFYTDDLKDLFTFVESDSTTHETLGCRCADPTREQPLVKRIKLDTAKDTCEKAEENDDDTVAKRQKGMAQLDSWEHFPQHRYTELADEVFYSASYLITFIFRNRNIFF